MAHMDTKHSSKNPYHLIEAAYKPKTLHLYRCAVLEFCRWCRQRRLCAHDAEQLDELLLQYFNWVYEQRGGRGKSIGANTLAGVCLFLPAVQRRLPMAAKAVRGWSILQKTQRRPPLTWNLMITVAIAVRLAANGFYPFAIATLLPFDCTLRSGELCRLRVEDIVDGGRTANFDAEYQKMAITIVAAKGGDNQWVVNDPAVRTLLRRYIAAFKARARAGTCTDRDAVSDTLFGNVNDYRRQFTRARDQLGLHLYTPHSLRHGGATRLHLQGWSIDDVRTRGRWRSVRSATYYIQTGRAILARLDVPDLVARYAAVLVTDVVLALSLAQQH